MKSFKLLSVATSKTLTYLLYVLLIFQFMVGGYLIAFVFMWDRKSEMPFLEYYEAIVYSPFVFVLICGIVFLVWIYRLHKDLKTIYPQYPISSGSALIRIILPLYNLWGFWNVFRTISDHFEKETGDIQKTGVLISQYVTFMYAAGIVSRIASRALEKWPEKDIDEFFFLALGSSYFVDMILTLIWLKLTSLLKVVFTEKIDSFKYIIKHPSGEYTLLHEAKHEVLTPVENV